MAGSAEVGAAMLTWSPSEVRPIFWLMKLRPGLPFGPTKEKNSSVPAKTTAGTRPIAATHRNPRPPNSHPGSTKRGSTPRQNAAAAPSAPHQIIA